MNDTLELRFSASIQGLASGDRNLATFYLMDTGVNRNGWRVTEKALEAALPSLLGKPLGCIPGYRVDHVHHPLTVGRFISADAGEGCAVAVAEVTGSLKRIMSRVAWDATAETIVGPAASVMV